MGKSCGFLASAVAVFMTSLPVWADEPQPTVRTVQPQRNFGSLPPADASTFDLVRGNYPATTDETVTEYYDDSVALDPRTYSALGELEATADAEAVELSYVGYGSAYRPWIYRPSYAYRYGLYRHGGFNAPYYGGYPTSYFRPYGWPGAYGYGARYSFRYDVGVPYRALYGPTFGKTRWDSGVIGYTHPLHYRGYEGSLYW